MARDTEIGKRRRKSMQRGRAEACDLWEHLEDRKTVHKGFRRDEPIRGIHSAINDSLTAVPNSLKIDACKQYFLSRGKNVKRKAQLDLYLLFKLSNAILATLLAILICIVALISCNSLLKKKIRRILFVTECVSSESDRSKRSVHFVSIKLSWNKKKNFNGGRALPRARTDLARTSSIASYSSFIRFLPCRRLSEPQGLISYSPRFCYLPALFRSTMSYSSARVINGKGPSPLFSSAFSRYFLILAQSPSQGWPS